ncbi:LysM peptidoglycan-binding domain-containing protein [Desulfolucanica intricata]|uniref:LysM peptidoglycan-binding domain-containing protein n=1 Tax=Desulfolucanica intricata TaxID=1285191 RepID=UPI00082E15CF|nr:LysM peptidoglycan-binding domain-containing protein [Desulfolucanica intricata]
MKKYRVLTMVLVLGILVTSLFGCLGTSPAQAGTTTTTYLVYYVQPGDTLWVISNNYGTSVNKLVQSNNLKSSMIYVGQRLLIPLNGGRSYDSQKYVVKYGDTLYLIAKRFGTTVSKLVSTNNLKSYNIYPGQVLYIPADNSIPSPAPQNPTQPQPAPSTVSGMTADEQQMLNLVNQERAKVGLPALKSDLNLVKVARLKAQDMIKLNYFSHTSPTYGSPFDMMKQFGISYSYAGENLAGASTVQSAHTNLMNSPGHRANILSKNFGKVGIGIVDGGPYGKMFVQMFTN